MLGSRQTIRTASSRSCSSASASWALKSRHSLTYTIAIMSCTSYRIVWPHIHACKDRTRPSVCYRGRPEQGMPQRRGAAPWRPSCYPMPAPRTMGKWPGPPPALHRPTRHALFMLKCALPITLVSSIFWGMPSSAQLIHGHPSRAHYILISQEQQESRELGELQEELGAKDRAIEALIEENSRMDAALQVRIQFGSCSGPKQGQTDQFSTVSGPSLCF